MASYPHISHNGEKCSNLFCLHDSQTSMVNRCFAAFGNLHGYSCGNFKLDQDSNIYPPLLLRRFKIPGSHRPSNTKEQVVGTSTRTFLERTMSAMDNAQSRICGNGWCAIHCRIWRCSFDPVQIIIRRRTHSHAYTGSPVNDFFIIKKIIDQNDYIKYILNHSIKKLIYHILLKIIIFK